jgi:hypothetical protein
LYVADCQSPEDLLGIDSDGVRDLSLDHIMQLAGESPPDEPAAILLAEEAAIRAREWMFYVLTWHFHKKNTNRARETRLLRSAVEKEMTYPIQTLNPREAFYMALTDVEPDSCPARLMLAFSVVLLGDLATRLASVSERSIERIKRARRVETTGARADEVRGSIIERAQAVIIDHFACAVPLSIFKDTYGDLVQEAACPICQLSYTDTKTHSIEELLADYPIRIKYCGHIVGKSCLERWMETPKIDEAKYPYRSCPLCRIKIEGVPAPAVPVALREHIRSDMRATMNVRQLEEMDEFEFDECLDAISACMSEEIAAEQLLAEVSRTKEPLDVELEGQKKYLEGRLEKLREEKWAWGFRGNTLWNKIRDEWMESGVARNS